MATGPEEYQRQQNEVLERLPGIYVIADDILSTGQRESKEEALEDHDRIISCIIRESQTSKLKAQPQETEA